MPLLSKSHETSPPATTPARKGTLFGRHRTPSPVRTENSSRSGGLFHRRSSSTSSEARRKDSVHSGSHSTGGIGSFFSSNRGSDPSILTARQAVNDAEEAEREADRALTQARHAVREARQHAKFLEQEAKDE